jgi:hypothetical protein
MSWRDDLSQMFNHVLDMHIFYAKFAIRATYKLKTGKIRLTDSWVREVSKTNNAAWEDLL